MEEKTQVSEVGFESGTFRSCVEHSIHYATKTPPIPDVLLVLVAPKHINRNVTTTLQSRFTPTAPPHRPPFTPNQPALFTDHHPSTQYTSHSFPDPLRIWRISWFFP